MNKRQERLIMFNTLWLFLSLFTPRIGVMFNGHSAHLQKLVFQRLSQVPNTFIYIYFPEIFPPEICTRIFIILKSTGRHFFGHYAEVDQNLLLDLKRLQSQLSRQRANKHCASYAPVIRTKKQFLVISVVISLLSN